MPRAWEVFPGSDEAVTPRSTGRTGDGLTRLPGCPGDHQSSGGACRERSKAMSVNPDGDVTYGIKQQMDGPKFRIHRWMAPNFAAAIFVRISILVHSGKFGDVYGGLC
jgi:hypothetical protein